MKNYIKLSNSLLLIMGCTFLFLSCSNETENIEDEQSIVNLMTELMTIEHLSEPDSIKAVKILKFMQTNNIKIDSLKTAILKFEKDPAYWHSVYNKIKTQLKEESNRVPSPR